MRLRVKLTVTIALACVVPILGATLLGRELVQRRSKAEFERLLRDGRSEVLRQVQRLEQSMAEAVARLADPEDRFIGPILIALAEGGPDDETFRHLALVAHRVMKERGLDVLSVLDSEGKILASGHFTGRMGDLDSRAKRGDLIASAKPVLLPERVMEAGKPVTRLTLQRWRLGRSPLGTKVIVAGGRFIGPRFLTELRLRGNTEVLIQDASGRRLAGPRDWGPLAKYPSRVVTLKDPRGRDAVRITLAVPDVGLRTTLTAINVAAGALALSGLLLSLILGSLAARRISMRLQDLVRGAEAVAGGDLEQRLPVHARDEVGELVESFNRMTSELKDSKERLVTAERLAAWQEIARRIAHEIKNPLFPIQTSIETLRKVHRKQHPDFEEIFEESTTVILEEVQRLKTIVTEFSQFARLPKPRLAPCDLGEVLAAVCTLYAGERLAIERAVPAELPPVMGDKEQLTQIFVNLIKNAEEAMRQTAAPQLAICARVRERTLVVEVQDNGPGFSPELGASIFAPYVTTKERSGGTGLGLSIVHRIVTDHGGSIEARAEPGQGALFIIELPLA